MLKKNVHQAVGRDDFMCDVKGVARRDELSQNYQSQTFSSTFLDFFISGKVLAASLF